ncbi:MAG: hypothetical protein AAGA65_16200 [Actinomycetota bacterium]
MMSLRSITAGLGPVTAVVLVLWLAACGSVTPNDPAGPVTGSGDERPTSLIMVPVSAALPPPCGEDAVLDGEGDTGICLVLGQSWVNQSAIERARASARPFGPSVQLDFTDEGIEAFNEIAARCFAMTDDCATGRLAIVNNGSLVSAPQINAERFEKDQIVIGGSLRSDFDMAWAEALADAINGS